MAAEYASVPASSRSTPTPFHVSIHEEQLSEFKQLLKLSKLGPKTYENQRTDRRFGITYEWLAHAKQEWENWDWRQTETRINSVPNFTLPIEDKNNDNKSVHNIHFAALFSQSPNAVPLLFLHGWPGNFMEFLPMLEILRERYTPTTLPYHVVVPSLPGYAFSSAPPLDRNFEAQDIARILHELMCELGFGEGYVVQGGDIGSKVARVMGVLFDAVKAVHLNFCIMPRPPSIADDSQLSEPEKQGLGRASEFKEQGSAYSLLHATRPSTIGFVLAANPLSLLAWIGEKFLAWTDQDPPLEDIFASVTLYWLTETFPRSIYPYRQIFTPDRVGAHDNPAWYIGKPLGFSWFPKELAPIPRSWVATTGDLVFYREHRSGGHFAAVERPEVLLRDVEEFVQQVWRK